MSSSVPTPVSTVAMRILGAGNISDIQMNSFEQNAIILRVCVSLFMTVYLACGWPLKLYVCVFYVFNVFFQNPKTVTFYVFRVVAHVFSNSELKQAIACFTDRNIDEWCGVS